MCFRTGELRWCNNLFTSVENKAKAMKTMALCLIFFGVLQSWTGSSSYFFLTSNRHGGWWAGSTTFAAGVLFLLFQSRFHGKESAFAQFLLGFAVTITNLVSCIEDGNAAMTIKSNGCFDPITNGTWGHESYIERARYQCPRGAPSDFNGYKCICAAHFDNSCYAYSLSVGSDCGSLYSVYYYELTAVTVTTAVILIFLLSFVSLTFVDYVNFPSITTQNTASSTVTVQGTIPESTHDNVRVSPSAPLNYDGDLEMSHFQQVSPYNGHHGYARAIAVEYAIAVPVN